MHAATQVLESELGTAPKRGNVGLHRSAYTSDEVTAVVGVTGSVAGMVLFSMSEATARGMVGINDGPGVPRVRRARQSGIGEIGNVITGRAALLLAEAGFPSDLAPPMLIIGKGTMLSTLDVQRLVIPLETEFGAIEVQVTLKETAGASRRAA